MSEATKIRQVEFSDLYLGHPILDDRFSDVPGAAINPLPAGPSLRDDLDQMIAVCRTALEKEPAATDFKVSHDSVTYRVSAISASGGTVFVLRKIADRLYSLAELGIPLAYIQCLMSKNLSGLLIVSGAGKAGKTTTACALLKARLNAFGGVAVTGEDPIELAVEGNYGSGICYQTAMPRNRQEFEAAFRKLLRWGARIILIGEIRDPEIAAEVLKASMNGHLIITTMLAENVIQTVSKLHALAGHRLASGCAQSLIADGLAGVLHQKIVPGTKHRLATEFLFAKEAPVMRTIIRSGKYEMLASEISQQTASMIHASAASARAVSV